jgi:hypothetical protein
MSAEADGKFELTKTQTISLYTTGSSQYRGMPAKPLHRIRHNDKRNLKIPVAAKPERGNSHA